MSEISRNMAAVMATNAFYVGGNWGFLKNDDEEYKSIYSYIKGDREVESYDVANGLLVLSNYQNLMQAISQVEPITPDVQERQRNRVNIESAELNKLLNAIRTRNGDYLKQFNVSRGNGYIELNIALYSCNSTHKISVNGLKYPAYALTVMEACKVMVQYSNYIPIYLFVGDRFESIKNFKTQQDVAKLMKNLEIANSMNGAFLTVRFEV